MLAFICNFPLQSPVVRVSVDNLDFGLIQLGRSASLQFEVINESHCTVSFHLKQLVKQKKVFMVSLSASSDFACKYKHGIINNNY